MAASKYYGFRIKEARYPEVVKWLDELKESDEASFRIVEAVVEYYNRHVAPRVPNGDSRPEPKRTLTKTIPKRSEEPKIDPAPDDSADDAEDRLSGLDNQF